MKWVREITRKPDIDDTWLCHYSTSVHDIVPHDIAWISSTATATCIDMPFAAGADVACHCCDLMWNNCTVSMWHAILTAPHSKLCHLYWSFLHLTSLMSRHVRKTRTFFSKYADHVIAKYVAKICGNRLRLHIRVNMTWYIFGGWDSTVVI